MVVLTKMIVDLVFLLSMGAILSTVFFFADMYNQHVNIHPSFIAGISVSYFFLVVLPEIAAEMPTMPFSLPALEYMPILVGISYAHLIEKFILQHVEIRSREKAELLLKKKEVLDDVEDQFSMFLVDGLKRHDLDDKTIDETADTIKRMIATEAEVKAELLEMKKVVHDHVNHSLENYHDITEFIYHFIVGIILAGLLLVNIIEALLFFTIAVMMATLSHAKSRQRIFSNLDIEMDYTETRRKKALLALAAPAGLVTSFILELVFVVNMEFVYLLFSFIAGALLYNIIREVIPEKEKGKIKLFAIGLFGFSVLVIVLNVLGLAF